MAGTGGGNRDEGLPARVDDWYDDLSSAVAGLYPGRADEVTADVLRRAQAAAGVRKEPLVALDRSRERDADWYQRPERIGYSAFAERFGGDLRGVAARIGYLQELGVDVLHLMSVLRSRAGDSDGGYAIDDYRHPDPALGSIDDLEALIDSLRTAGISICLDLVMNHTSADHDWAVAARRGSVYHRNLYVTFADRDRPDAYEATLPEVFPTMSPGNFTWVEELRAWVWTTFREFQWDLDWANPDVLVEMVDIVLHLANLGVEIIRLDAVAFTWKRVGTNSQNQPEAHLVAQVLRAAVGIAAPATILLAEAIVGPDDLIPYLGGHERQRRECQLAYHNQLMVQGWSMLATGEVGLGGIALGRFPAAPAGTTWLTYVRCHDDIGWAVSDGDAATAGLDGYAHRRFLAAFYRGDFPGSFARGTAFSANPATGDERTSGMASTLSGIAAGMEAGQPEQVDLGVDRLLLLYGLAFGFAGLPMVYMGDELGLGDDDTWRLDPGRSLDSRWAHRPVLRESQMADRHDPATTAGAVWAGMRRLVSARRSCGVLHGGASVEVVASGNRAVFAWVRRHPRYGALLGLANIGATAASVPPSVLGVLGLTGGGGTGGGGTGGAGTDRAGGGGAGGAGGGTGGAGGAGAAVVDLLDPAASELLALPAYRARWLTADRNFRTAPAVPTGPPMLERR